MNAELPQNEDPQAVADNPKRDDCQCQNGLGPTAAQEQVPSQEAGNQEHQAGVDAAAFGRNLQAKPGQLELRALSENRSSRELQKPIGRLGGTLLQKVLNPAINKIRKRHSEKEKRGWKCQRAQCRRPKQRQTTAQQQTKIAQRHQGQIINRLGSPT